MAGGFQNTAENDTNRYTNLLQSAGKAVSDLRMQKAQNREKIFNTAGTAVYNKGVEKEQNVKEAAKIALSIFGGPLGAMAGNMIGGGGGAQTPKIGGEGTSPTGQPYSGSYNQSFGGD